MTSKGQEAQRAVEGQGAADVLVGDLGPVPYHLDGEAATMGEKEAHAYFTADCASSYPIQSTVCFGSAAAPQILDATASIRYPSP